MRGTMIIQVGRLFCAGSTSALATLLSMLLVLLLVAPVVQSFSTLPNHSSASSSSLAAMDPNINLMSSDSSNLDRFRSVCLVGPEGKSAVDEFDPALYSSLENVDGDNDLWVAVYRSNNNKPSVVVRDDFFRAMNDATTTSSDATSNDNANSSNSGGKGFGKDSSTDDSATNAISTVSSAATFLSDTMPGLLEIPSTKPVAIARLQKSQPTTATTSDDDTNDTKTVYLLDSMRCSLKKENQDESCDGGSEFVEAISVAVDTLLLKHLQRLLQNRDNETLHESVVFEGTVRTKATLFSSKLFEERGFTEVEVLSRDMATHVSNYEACFSRYADRTIEAEMAAGTRDRALQIVALLGRLDPELQKREAATSNTNGGSGGDDDDDYDPWANMQLYRS